VQPAWNQRCANASAAGALFEARCLAQRDFEILVGPLANPLPEDGEPPGPQGRKFETGWNLGSGTGVSWPCQTFQLIRSYVSARARQ